MPEWTEKLNRYGDRIYYDATLGVAGTGWPIGTAEHPSNVLADIRTICVRENIHTIAVRGHLTLDAAMNNYDFIGSQFNLNNILFDYVSLNGKSIDSATLRNLYVEGVQGGGGYCLLENCGIDITGFNGWAKGCILFNIISPPAGEEPELYDCRSGGPAASISMLGSTASLRIKGWKGTLVIGNLNAAGRVYLYASDSSRVELSATCTAGDIYIYGDVILTDNSAGSTVHNHSTRGAVRTGTFTLLAGVAEQDCLEFLAAADISKQQIDVELDMSALAQINTVREKVMVDGVNYRQISAKAFPTVFDAGTKCVILSFVQKGSSYKITLQASVTEGINMDIPYRVMVRDLS